jgi:hypothetical protein
VLQDAIHAYHDLLTPDLAAESQARLDEQQRRRGLGFGDRPLCTVLRPRFLTPGQYRFIRDRVRILLGAFNASHQAALADPGFRRQFRLTDAEETLFSYDPGYRCPMPTSRLDAFFVPNADDQGGVLRFTEFNAETPAAPAYTDTLAEVFLTLPIMGAFLRRYHAVLQPARPGVYHALVSSYQEWARRRDLPRIAILDWKEVPTHAEFVLFERYFHDHGLECVIADPREVEYRDGQLLAGDFHVTLLYKRVLISELIERGGRGLDGADVRGRAALTSSPFAGGETSSRGGASQLAGAKGRLRTTPKARTRPTSAAMAQTGRFRRGAGVPRTAAQPTLAAQRRRKGRAATTRALKARAWRQSPWSRACRQRVAPQPGQCRPVTRWKVQRG